MPRNKKLFMGISPLYAYFIIFYHFHTLINSRLGIKDVNTNFLCIYNFSVQKHRNFLEKCYFPLKIAKIRGENLKPHNPGIYGRGRFRDSKSAGAWWF
jgi:hypothetical protein